MKKILLFVALVAGVFAAQAANGFTVIDKHSGNPINNGDKVYAVWEDEFIEQFAAEISVNSKTEEELFMQIKVEAPENLPTNFTYQFCWSSCYSPTSFPWTNDFIAPAAATVFGNSWKLDVMGATAEQRAQTNSLKVTLINMEDESDTLAFDLMLVDEAGVDAIEADNAAAEYFTIDGRKVNNPENGLYIVRQGNRVEKVMLKK